MVDGDLVVKDNDILREDVFTAIEKYGDSIILLYISTLINELT